MNVVDLRGINPMIKLICEKLVEKYEYGEELGYLLWSDSKL